MEKNKLKILFLDRNAVGPYELKDIFSKYGKYTELNLTNDDDIASYLKDYDVEILNRIRLGKKEFEKALKIYFEIFENIRESKKQNVLLGYVESKIIILIKKLRDKEDKKYYIEKYLRINNNKEGSNNTKLIIMLAEILIENKEYKEAEKYYQGIIKKDENITQDELYTYVYLLLCLNNYVEARNILEKMLKVKEKPYLLINIRTD